MVFLQNFLFRVMQNYHAVPVELSPHAERSSLWTPFLVGCIAFIGTFAVGYTATNLFAPPSALPAVSSIYGQVHSLDFFARRTELSQVNGLHVMEAHKKGSGSTKNGRDSNSKRRGVKVYGDQAVRAGGMFQQMSQSCCVNHAQIFCLFLSHFIHPGLH